MVQVMPVAVAIYLSLGGEPSGRVGPAVSANTLPAAKPKPNVRANVHRLRPRAPPYHRGDLRSLPGSSLAAPERPMRPASLQGSRGKAANQSVATGTTSFLPRFGHRVESKSKSVPFRKFKTEFDQSVQY